MDSDVVKVADGKDVDSVLLRVPTGLRRVIVDEAKGQRVSQNTYITASLLYSAVVFGELPHVGMPKNLLMLLTEIDKAVRENDAVLHAFHEKDWEDVKPIVDLFASSGIIEGLKARRDTVGHETIAFTFHFSKTGAAIWKIIGPRLMEATKATTEQKGLLAAGAA